MCGAKQESGTTIMNSYHLILHRHSHSSNSRLRSNSAVSWVFMKGNLARVVKSLCGYYRQEVGLMVDSSRLPDLNQLARLGQEQEVESLIRLVLGVAVTCPDRARHISIILSQSTQVLLTFITFASVICQKM